MAKFLILKSNQLRIYDKCHIFAKTKQTIMKKLLFLGILWLSIHQVSAQYAADLKVETKIDNVSAQQFNQMIQKDAQAQIIDIRTPQEYKMGHIKGAVLVNFYDPNFAQNIQKAGLDKNKTIYIYCRSGHRSGNSLRIFKALGFTHIVNLAHGINDWYRSSLPLEK